MVGPPSLRNQTEIFEGLVPMTVGSIGKPTFSETVMEPTTGFCPGTMTRFSFVSRTLPVFLGFPML